MKKRLAIIGALALLNAACSSGSGGGQPEPPAANLPPAVAAIPDQVIEANKPGDPIPVTLDDESPGSVSVSTMSTDTQVVADDGIAIVGNGGQRSITVTPNPDVVGDTRISVIVTDQLGLSASTSFLLSVRAEQKSMQEFVRAGMSSPADGEPELINAVEFAQDAELDDFGDLFAE